MLLDEGDKLLISHRRLFEKDEPRYFIGEVMAYDVGVAKVRGHSFVRDLTSGSVIRKEDLRTKIISIASGAILVYQLSDDTDIDSACFESRDGALVLKDDAQLQMNMAELPHHGSI